MTAAIGMFIILVTIYDDTVNENKSSSKQAIAFFEKGQNKKKNQEFIYLPVSCLRRYL